MGNCKDCCYWNTAFNGEKFCIYTLRNQDYRADRAVVSSLGAIVEGVIVLATGPDFGCVLFEQKESKQ